MKLYDIIVNDAKHNPVSLSEYKGKVLIIVNTATGCGFTPQYKELQALYDQFKYQGLEILDFPCNQFGAQAPGSESEIQSFCELNYQTTFRLFEKIDVNGENESPLFTHLKQQKGGLFGDAIKWNFTKFLIDRQGDVIERFAPQISPKKMVEAIKKLL